MVGGGVDWEENASRGCETGFCAVVCGGTKSVRSRQKTSGKGGGGTRDMKRAADWKCGEVRGDGKERKKRESGHTQRLLGVWACAGVGCGLERHGQYLNVLHFPPRFFY